ncbi:formimidoylglutamate deiminase [uncultured Tateyamaria sp.]|uniref:formimidoylglutamate deiminase n=1 Tax=Tateyamaria sp. 1078 TaxID=3417464 RepID=UPI00261173E2|nr:formimidoylglutamate deiminase [uncultured Tateyamaria sp.]
MIHARHALLPTGWGRDVRIVVADHHIAQVLQDVPAQPDDTRVDTLLPALGNLHSHSFQRAMAGMTEHRRAGRDSFWTWRTLMYRFVDLLTPEQVEAIAALTFAEMQEAGYASVGEFHYLHHQTGGRPYDNRAELSLRIMAAAQDTGIGLTHLPVLYSYGGAGQAPLSEGQMRFGNDVDAFADLVDAARAGLAALPADAAMGIAPHSLRATCPDDLHRAIADHSGSQIHIHIAEQPKEVADIRDWLGARPVDWLLHHAEVDARWCLIHATHMTPDETRALAATGAVAGLCPITEANLGDGPFNGPTYLEAGGAFGVGSDSNVNISLTEELRTLEYSQRLRDMARNIMVPGDGPVGQSLYTRAARGGAQALGRAAGQIAQGRLADLVAVDSTDPALCTLTTDQLLDGLVFAAKDGVVTDLWSAGRHRVRGGAHVAKAAIVARYKRVMGDVLASL